MAPHIRILFMSGYSDTPPGLMRSHAEVALVRKPFSGDELVRAVRGALDAV
jgi:hypothetical protein